MKITEKLIEGAKLKKLALGLEKVDGKVVKQIRCDGTKGFFIRLNQNCEKGGKHTFNGQLPNGKKFKIGYVGDITVKQAKQVLADERDAFAAQRTDTKSSTPTERGTLRYCFSQWQMSRPLSKSAKFDPVTQATTTKKSQKTIDQVAYWIERYTSDWMDRQIADIDSAEIDERAKQIASGVFLGVVKNEKQLKDGDLYNNAHHWLKSVSAVVSSTTRSHKSLNWFKVTLTEDFPARDGGHRRLSEYEIAAILNVSRDDFRIKTTRRLDQPVKGRRRVEGELDFDGWRKMLLLKFLLLSGFRIGGARELKISEINGVNINRPSMDKSGRPHKLPITTQLRELLDECIRINKGEDTETPSDWPREIVNSEYLFCSGAGNAYGSESKLFEMARNRLKNLEKVDLPELQSERMRKAKLMTAHDLRVTLASEAADADVSQAQAELFLGQSAPKGVHWRYRQEGEAKRKKAFDDLTAALQATHDRMFKIKKMKNPSRELRKEDD